MERVHRRLYSVGVAALFGTLLAPAAPAAAGDVTVFVAKGRPPETWNRGYGATLSTSWFSILNLEGEVARIPGSLSESSMTSFTASALLAPPVGIVTPYGGLGVGLFRQSLGPARDTGTL